MLALAPLAQMALGIGGGVFLAGKGLDEAGNGGAKLGIGLALAGGIYLLMKKA